MDQTDDDRLSLFLDLLSDPARRRLLYALEAHDPAGFERLADVLAGWQLSRNGDAVVRPADYRRIVTQLRHVHLPRLTDAGVVQVDENGDRIRLVSTDSMLHELLATTREFEASVANQLPRRDEGRTA